MLRPGPRWPAGRRGQAAALCPSPGWQVGAVFPAVPCDDTCCHAGLCVISSELLMSHGSCGGNSLSASVSHLGPLMDLSQCAEASRGRRGAGRRAGRCAVAMLPLLPSSRRSHSPLALTCCPSLFPALCLLLFLSLVQRG